MENASDRTYHILLIDDDELDRKIFKRNLSNSNLDYHLEEAINGQKALEYITQYSFDCIFLDYHIPGSDSLEMIRTIKANDPTTGITIMTAHGDESIAIEMLKAGALDYLNKADISAGELERIIHTAVKIKSMEQEKLRAEEAKKSYVSKLEAILESTNSSVCSVDRNRRLTTFNKAFKDNMKRLFGADVKIGDELFGFESATFDAAAEKADLMRALSGEHFTKEENYGSTETNRYFYEISYNPVVEDNNEVTGVAIFSQDVTEKKRVEQALTKARNDALKAAQVKSDFLSNMSHEIRTPMNAIIGITDLLLDNVESKTHRDYLNSIKYSADNLLVIINDILDFSKIEAGKIIFESITFDLHENLEELRKAFTYKTDEKDLELMVNIDAEVPKMIIGDPYRLNQILFNLLGNAIKFTIEGSIIINVKVKQQVGDRYLLHFAVTDTGIGISNDKINTIFESFTQAYTDTSRKFGGTGLGLAITKNLVELQNGYLGLQSSINKGSTFYFEIAYTTAKNILPVKPESESNAAGKPESLNGYRVLLVEDNTMNQLVAQQILLKWQAWVNIAENGSEALGMLEQYHYDIVLMDLQMPEMNGYEATEQIRKGKGIVLNPGIPIIALTADAFEETREKVLAVGMNDFITKPFKQQELYSKIIKYLNI
jgi:PAS domain S-box-containing protein